MCGLNGLTAVQLSEDVDARLIVDVACRRGQELGSVLEERGPFDLMLIMAGTNDLVMGIAPCMVILSIQALHAECQMGGVRTVAEDLSFGALSEAAAGDVGLPYDSTNGLWESDGLHFSKAGSREFGRRMATCVRELLRPQEFVSLAGEVMWLLSKSLGFSRPGLRSIGQRGRAAPGKSRGNFLGNSAMLLVA